MVAWVIASVTSHEGGVQCASVASSPSVRELPGPLAVK